MGETNRNSKVIRISKEAYERMKELLDKDNPTMGLLVDDMLQAFDESFSIPEGTTYKVYYRKERQ